mmetsp:Transcript_71920/g.181481  ORF Transcript_71920/g.181481 Transcript_71920/m.181481 type:complete len:223 (+) Transcript_71920:635-1303(+)
MARASSGSRTVSTRHKCVISSSVVAASRARDATMRTARRTFGYLPADLQDLVRASRRPPPLRQPRRLQLPPPVHEEAVEVSLLPAPPAAAYHWRTCCRTRRIRRELQLLPPSLAWWLLQLQRSAPGSSPQTTPPLADSAQLCRHFPRRRLCGECLGGSRAPTAAWLHLHRCPACSPHWLHRRAPRMQPWLLLQPPRLSPRCTLRPCGRHQLRSVRRHWVTRR